MLGSKPSFSNTKYLVVSSKAVALDRTEKLAPWGRKCTYYLLDTVVHQKFANFAFLQETEVTECFWRLGH